MKLEGFIGPAYTLDSVNVDAQRCVNLYPEIIESGRGKEGQQVYLKATPGLEKILTVGDGPIRCVHTDSIGRCFVVSGNKLYFVNNQANWRHEILVQTYASQPNITGINTSTDAFTMTAHTLDTGAKVKYTHQSDSFPAPLDGDTFYYVIKVDANTIKLAASPEDAIAGTAINITGSYDSNIQGLSVTNPSSLTDVLNSGIDDDDNSITYTNHGFHSGVKVRVRTTGILPTGLAVDTDYYLVCDDANTMKFATSIANADAGTFVDLTASTADWTANLVGASGIYGGTSVNLSTSSGIVKAASMSSQGNGTDSSTVFVDGVANYLFDDGVSGQSFQALGDQEVLSAEFVVSSANFTVYVTQNISSYTGYSIYIRLTSSGSVPSGQVAMQINQYPSTVDGPVIRIDFQSSADTTLTSEEFVEYLNSGAVAGKTVVLTDTDGLLSILQAEGGDNAGMIPAGGGVSIFSNVQRIVPLVDDTLSGFGFGPVPTATDIIWTDGYFIVNQANTNKFFVSDIQSFNINALNFASSEGSPDIVRGLAVNRRDLYVFNDLTTEVFANTGNADFPYERVQGGFIEIGCAAGYSVARIENTIFWLGRSRDGQGSVYSIRGLQYQRVSTHAIEQAIAGYADISTAVAYTYHSKGHDFYVLNFDEATWVFDLSTGLWHERAYTNNGTEERHRAQTLAFHSISGKHIVGDYENAKLYVLNDAYYKDDTDFISRIRVAPHISSGLNRIFYHQFQLDMETGVGLDGGVQGSSPQVMLDFSDDGGHTFSSESWALADAGGGQIGEYRKRVIWRRLGKSRDRIFRVKMTDPVPCTWIHAQIMVDSGAS